MPHDFDAEVRLTNPSLTDQGDEPMRPHGIRHLGQLGFSTDQLGNRSGKIAGAAVGCAAADFRRTARQASIRLVRHSGKAQSLENALAFPPVDCACRLEWEG
jgi:hypothetical protein